MSEKTNGKKVQPNRLYRSEENKVIGGVSTGLGEYFNIDPTIIRILFIFLAVFGGSGIIIYLILWAIIPSKSNLSKNDSDTIKGNLEEMRKRAKSAFETKSNGDNNRMLLAIILVVLGALFLFDNLNVFRFDIGKLWPILLILLGLLILRRR